MKIRCKGYHDWNVGAGIKEDMNRNVIENGIFVYCSRCKCQRKAMFVKPILRHYQKGKVKK